MNRRAMTYLRPAPFRTLAAFTALALGLGLAACNAQPGERPPLEGASIGGPFTLMDKAGKTVTWDQFKGRWRLVYFGYTYCPDACPLDMQALMAGFAGFAKAHPDLAAKVQPIFITIDPVRDTPQVVGQWTAAFSPRLLGLTGTPDQVAKAAKAFAVYYKKGEALPGGGYLMDHSRTAFLMDPDGKPIAMLLPVEQGADPREAIAAELAKWVK
ncbi:electron transport protein [Novosphingobium sp. Rr 2-17]|uniref:SCO family protein n=1 Tax=Novosphingobium sp. Rr 2-17 TaxID=555793 RepID=UPI0002698E60|nr:SCO family protein [Novosphingobium sp. Rr 2-17]EIZ80924.1 electron transport protein [Novosphingobium sp. Rr 2-17]